MLTVYHSLNAIITLGIGVYCTVLPVQAANFLGIQFTQPAGITDFRATYGGICLALGAFFALAVIRNEPSLASANWLAVLLYFGLASTRFFGIWSERPTTFAMIFFGILEVLFFVVGVVAILKSQS